MKTKIIKLDFDNDCHLISRDVSFLSNNDPPDLAVDAKGDKLDQVPFPLYNGDFDINFKETLDAAVDDGIMPFVFWVIKWDDLFGMAVVSKTAYPRHRILVDQIPVRQ